MKKVLLSFLLLISILINYKLIFAMDNLKENNETMYVKEVANDLFKKRAVLWNKIFDDDEKIDDINEKLKEIVCEPLLTYDINAFKKLKTEYTNMDKILSVDVLKAYNVNCKEGKINADIEVEWFMEGLDKKYKENICYRIILLKVDDEWKISDYSIIE